MVPNKLEVLGLNLCSGAAAVTVSWSSGLVSQIKCSKDSRTSHFVSLVIYLEQIKKLLAMFCFTVLWCFLFCPV